jgi:group I intron endonuclease
MVGIYKITSPTKKVYIGQSTDIKNRFKSYKRLNCKKQIRLYNSFIKYGVDKHKFEILCECDIKELNDKERYYQDIFSAIGKTGLNCRLTASNDRSGKLSEEHKRKIGEAGKKRITSEETKKKLSEAHKGKKISNKHKEILMQSRKKIILNTETGIFYFGGIDASKSINITSSTLNSYLTNQRINKTSLIYV